MNRNFHRIPDGSIEGGRPFWMMTVVVIIFRNHTFPWTSSSIQIKYKRSKELPNG